MPTIIDALVVELGLDAKGFTEGTQEIIRRLRQLEDDAKRTGGGIERTGSNVVSFFRQVEHPISSLRGHFERLATYIEKPRKDLTDLAATGRRAGSGVEAGALAGASGLRVLGVAGIAATATMASLGKIMKEAAESAQGVFHTGVGAGAAGTPIRQFSAISQALRIGGNVPEEQTQNWLANWRQWQNTLATSGQGSERVTNIARAGFQGDATRATGEQVLTSLAKYYSTLTEDLAITLGKYIDLTPEQSRELRRQGANLPGSIAAQQDTAMTSHQLAMAAELQTAQNRLATSWGNLSRKIYEVLDPAFAAFDSWLSKIIDDLTVGTVGTGIFGILTTGTAAAAGIPSGSWLDRFFKWIGSNGGRATSGGALGPGSYGQGLPAPGGQSSADPRGMIPIIRAAAIRNGIDPDVAVAVARSEGLGNPVGDNKTSFGAMMLHIGGGVGDLFRKDTGLDPSDPKNEVATIDYAMQYAAKYGWGAWHGAARIGIGDRQGIGTPSAPGAPGALSGSNTLALGDSIAAGIAGAGKLNERISQAGYGGQGRLEDRNDPSYQAVWGRTPAQVLATLKALNPASLRGKNVLLSGGASNDPTQVALAGEMIDFLLAAGANPELLGVSGIANEDKVNETLRGIATSKGVPFAPLLATGYGGRRNVHPNDYGINLAADMALIRKQQAGAGTTSGGDQNNNQNINVGKIDITVNEGHPYGVGGASGNILKNLIANSANTGVTS